MFFGPLITGLCDDLCDVYKEDFVSAKVKRVSSQEDHEGPSDIRSPPSGNDLDMEIERLRDNQGPAYTDLLSEILPSPTNFTSSIRKDDFTPATTAIGTESDVGRTTESGVLPTPDLASSSRNVGFDMETPSTWYEEEHGVENTVLSDIPEFDDSAGDLSFLEQDVNSPIGIRGTPEVGYSSSKQGETPGFDTLHARTRAVAQYLKEKSPRTPISEESGDLSLNMILEGKTRKICARMFFETLVLKNCGLVDAKQNGPYGDIALKVTSKLNEQF